VPKEQKQRTVTSSLRNVDLERRVFNPEWTDDFFDQRGNRALFLLCYETNSTLKDVRSSLSMKIKSIDVFSVALDKRCDVKDTTQLTIFVHAVTQDL